VSAYGRGRLPTEEQLRLNLLRFHRAKFELAGEVRIEVCQLFIKRSGELMTIAFFEQVGIAFKPPIDHLFLKSLLAADLESWKSFLSHQSVDSKFIHP
jgi:hypothetical protein